MWLFARLKDVPKRAFRHANLIITLAILTIKVGSIN